MNREKVISREYKLVLKTENFKGQESDLINNAKIFWTNLTKIISPVIKNTAGNLETINSKREISFFDTENFTLHDKDYIFRERKSLSDNKKEITLKFRHPDRYVSQDRDMQSQKTGKAETKFEEDIKAPFLKLYSFSSSRPITGKQQFKKIKHIVKLYPGLAHQLNKKSGEEFLSMVNNLAIQEIVITGGELIVSNDPLVNAECALIIWYGPEAFEADPLIVEFSFRYRNQKEKYSRETAQKAHDLFLLIQQGMKPWIDSNNATKTGFVYGSIQ
jgi:hypothetical protein